MNTAIATGRGAQRRDDILEYLKAYIGTNGYSPSVGEIAEALGTQKSNIHYHLLRLEEEGVVKHTKEVARSWRPS